MGERAVRAFRTLSPAVRFLWILAAFVAFEMILRALSLTIGN
jgi:hypothetical protein